MITNAVIENFRGIKHLELKGLTKFNLFIGENGVGKTSILEALILGASSGEAGVLYSLARNRSIGEGDMAIQLESIIHQAVEAIDENDVPRIKLTLDHGEGVKSDHPEGVYTTTLIPGLKTNRMLSDPDETEEELVCRVLFTTPEGEKLEGQLLRKGKSYREVQPQNRILQAEGLPLNINGRLRNRARLITLEELLKSKSKREALVKTLQLIKADIEGVILSGGNIYIDIKGYDESRIASSEGTGFLRVLDIALKVASEEYDIINIDEIDAGLHHSKMSQFWGNLRDTLKGRPTQLACTTHSEELIMKTLSCFEDSPEELGVFRVSKLPDGTHLAKKIRWSSLQIQKQGAASVHIS